MRKASMLAKSGVGIKLIACALLILCLFSGLANTCEQPSTGTLETPTVPEEITTGQLLGVDVSIYTGEVTLSTWQQMKQTGWEFAIVGAWHGRNQNTYAQQQLRGARQANMMVAAYLLLNFDNVDQSGYWQVEQALAAIGDQKSYLFFMAIDVELPEGWAITVNVNQRIQQAIDRVTQAGLRPIIYTSRGEWQTLTADTTAFVSLPLWDAQWDTTADLNANWIPYGGWVTRVGKQYSGNATLFGKNLDLNVFEATVFAAPTSPETDQVPTSVSGLAESYHPYTNNYESTWEISAPGVSEMRLHFAQLELAGNYLSSDHLYIYDKDNNSLITYNFNDDCEDEWTEWYAVDTMIIKLSTGKSGTAWGFLIDRIETRNY